MPDPDELYQKIILDHHRHPRHCTPLAQPSHRGEARNPLCGDEVTVTLRIETGIIREIACEAQGCALCRASGSLLASTLVGCPLSRALPLLEVATTLVASTEPTQFADLGELAALAAVRRFPARTRCAALPWLALQSALGDVGPIART